jgi:hypothetical protein
MVLMEVDGVFMKLTLLLARLAIGRGCHISFGWSELYHDIIFKFKFEIRGRLFYERSKQSLVSL